MTKQLATRIDILPVVAMRPQLGRFPVETTGTKGNKILFSDVTRGVHWRS